MDNKIKDIIKKAKAKNKLVKAEQNKQYFLDVLAWLSFTGLIRTNLVKPYKTKITLDMLIKAGKIEPRVNELLPALFYNLSFALSFKEDQVPIDLRNVIDAIKKDKKLPVFRSISPNKYLSWINSPAMELALKRLESRPRVSNKNDKTNYLGNLIKNKRIEFGFTQVHFAKQYNLSLRALRDVEQGFENTSIGRLKEILNVLGLEIEVRGNK